MAQANKLRKARSLFSTTLSTGIGTGTSDTLTPNSVTGLPTDTEVTLTIDRIDSGGTATPSLMERITGTISGGNLINYTRAVEGTEQAHASGAVVEYIWNADDWNDHIDHHLVEHNDAGTHKETALDSMIAGTEAQGDIIYHNGTIWTRLPKGTDGQVLTQVSNVPSWGSSSGLATDTLWDAAGDLVQGTGANTAAKLTIGSAGDVLRVVSGSAAWTGANFKVGADTRDMTASSGAVAYTGVGFQPKAVIFLAVKSTTTLLSIGFDDVTTHNNIQFYGNNTASFSTTKSIAITDGAASQDAYISAVGSDGFTLTWTKTGSPTGTANFFYLCLR